jgi:hypothetical protein
MHAHHAEADEGGGCTERLVSVSTPHLCFLDSFGCAQSGVTAETLQTICRDALDGLVPLPGAAGVAVRLEPGRYVITTHAALVDRTSDFPPSAYSRKQAREREIIDAIAITPAPQVARRLPLSQAFALLADEPQTGDYRTVLGIVAGKIISGEKRCPWCGVTRRHDPDEICGD